MEELVHHPDTTPGDKVYLSFALGQAYDHTGDYDSAFMHFSKGNFLVRSDYKYEAQWTKNTMAKIKSVFKDDIESHALPVTNPDITPIFIVGMPRSGTTLTEQILHAHPQVGAGGEMIYIEQLQAQAGFIRAEDYGGDIAHFPREKIQELHKGRDQKLKAAMWGHQFALRRGPVPPRYARLLLGPLHSGVFYRAVPFRFPQKASG